MKKVEGEFENLYFHDSPVKDVQISNEAITFTLAFGHVLEQHSQNQIEKTICAKDCQLTFSQVKEYRLKVYIDELKEWQLIESPGKQDLLQEILVSEVIDKDYYKIEGMTATPQWSEWEIKAQQVTLTWKVEGESWLTKE
jgi:hypothetical protein